MSKSVDAILPTVQSPLIEPLPPHNHTGHGEGGDWFGFKGSALLGGFNIVCCVVGVGLLGLPFAINQSGWVGVPLMLLTCLMATYTSYTIGRCMQAFPDLRTFGDIGHKAFGQWGKVAVSMQQHVTLVGVSAIFLIAMSSTVANVVDKSVYGSCRVLICVLTAVVWPHVFFHRYNEVAILSAFNILIAVFIAATVVVESLKSADPDAAHNWVNTSKDSSGRTYQMLIAFPTIAFAFGCHPILPDIYLELKRPASYGRMVVMAFVVILAFYLPVAYAGYHAFGDKVESPIFSNLSGTVVKVGEVALTMHVALSYGVVVNPSELALENLFYKCGGMGMYRHPNQIKFVTRWLVRLGLRTLLLGLSFGIAQGMPCFPDLLSLVSSVTVTFTSFMFPVAFYWRLCPMGTLERLWNVVIMVFAMVGCVTGTYNAIISFENCKVSSSGC